MEKRLIDFETVQKGLFAYFNDRVLIFKSRNEGWTWNDEVFKYRLKDVLSPKRIDTLGKIAFGYLYEEDIDESDYPTSVEFDKMMFLFKCDDQAALDLQDRLNEEHKIFVKAKQLT